MPVAQQQMLHFSRLITCKRSKASLRKKLFLMINSILDKEIISNNQQHIGGRKDFSVQWHLKFSTPYNLLCHDYCFYVWPNDGGVNCFSLYARHKYTKRNGNKHAEHHVHMKQNSDLRKNINLYKQMSWQTFNII